MRIALPISAAACLLLAGCAVAPGGGGAAYVTGEAARQQVIATEKAFAKTMADRDLKAFEAFLDDDTVFFSGPKPLHGKKAVVAFWSRFYAGARAPFSWTPEEVEVMDDGRLALSAGPVRDPQGQRVGRFTSVWRQEAPGRWRIVFDKGSEACDCEAKK